jgi:uncharacterized protein YaaN involved in tellurite resistance
MSDENELQPAAEAAIVPGTPAEEPGAMPLAVVARDPQNLAPAQLQQAKDIADAFDIEQPEAIVEYGTSAQRSISEFSAGLLNEVRTDDTGFVGDVLNELMVKVKDANVDGLTASGELSQLPLIGPLFDSFKRWVAKFEKVEVQIERIEGELDRAQHRLTGDIAMFDQLFEQNADYFDELNVYIAAGEMKLEELRETTLPELRQKAAESQDPMEAQRVRDLEALVNRFEKKVHNLKLSRMIAIQTAPQIRIIQANDQVLVDKIHTSILTTLPLWRSQIVIGVGLVRQRRALEMQHEVDETTNQLLAKNSEMLKQGSIEVAQANERGIVDIETLRKVNEDLVATIDETLRIQREGREKRAQVEVELATLERELKEKIQAAASGA